MADIQIANSPFPLPRVTIRFCTQCKWMLRAAYFAQELLSTFSTSLGEVALQPGTGGVFVVEIVTAMAETGSDGDQQQSTQQKVLWDRKTDGGFPETKELKRRVRDVIEPGRDLGHVDRDHHRGAKAAEGSSDAPAPAPASVGGGEQTEEGRDQQQQQQHEKDKYHRAGYPRPGDLLKDAIERSQPRPPPLHGQWGSNPIQRINPGGGVGGVRPLVKEPPEVANNIVRQKLAEKERARQEAEGHAGGGHAGADGEASASLEQDVQRAEEEKKEVCEDCV